MSGCEPIDKLSEAFTYCEHSKPKYICELCKLQERIEKLEDQATTAEYMRSNLQEACARIEKLEQVVEELNSTVGDVEIEQKDFMREVNDGCKKLEEQVKALQMSQVTILSKRDFETVSEALKNPAEPNEHLRAMMQANMCQSKPVESETVKDESQIGMCAQCREIVNLRTHGCLAKKTKTYWVNVYKYVSTPEAGFYISRVPYLSYEDAFSNATTENNYCKTISFEVDK